KKPLYSVIPLRNKFHNREQPICVNDELINKSWCCNASASEQLGVLSSCSDCFSNSPNSSVTKGRFPIVSYFSDLGCSIFPMVDSITCPVCWLLPKSNQYFGWLW